MTTDNLEDYTSADVEQTYKDIWNDISGNATPKEKPTIFLIGGQPGAGKSSTIRNIKNQLKEDCIVINYDDYRQYHPNANKLYEDSIKDKITDKYSLQTDDFMKDVGAKIIKEATKNNYNVVLEKTLSSEKSTIKLLENEFKNYDINIHIVTTNKENSINSSYTRFRDNKLSYEEGKTTEPPRFIDKDFQKKCYTNLARVSQLLADRFEDRIKDFQITKRNEYFEYSNVFDSKNKKHKPSMIENKILSVVYEESYGKKIAEKIEKRKYDAVKNSRAKNKDKDAEKDIK